MRRLWRKRASPIVKSRAVLEDAHTVRLVATGERVRAAYILIATGGIAQSRAAHPRHRARHFVERGVPSSPSCPTAC